MSLRISTPAETIERNIATALRDAMDDPQFSNMQFDFYSHDDETDEINSERVMIINRPTSLDDVPRIAREKAQELVAIKFTDNSVQGYEAVICYLEGVTEDGEGYDMTEQIIGDGDEYEWEVEYMPD